MPESQFITAKEREAFELMDQIEALKNPPEPVTDYDEKFDDLLTQFNDKPLAKLMIYAQAEGQNNGLDLLETLPVDKYDFEGLHEHIRNTWGAGDYRIRIREGKLWKANRLLTIRKPLTEKNANPELVGMTGIVGQLLQQIKLLNERKPDNGNDRMQFLQEMLIMKQLFSSDQPTQNNNSGLQEMLALITGLKSAGLISTPNDEKDVKESDGFMGFLSSMAPTLETIAKGAMQPRQQIPQQMPPAYQPQPAPQPEPDLTGEPDGLPEHVKALVSMALITLCNAADKQSDSEFYADWVLDQMPDEHLSEFVAMLEADNWLDTLDAMVYGRAKPHAVWFGDLRQQIFAQLVPDDSGQTDNDQERQSGND